MSLINMTANEYHAHPALGSSSLKRALITPSHYWCEALENPARLAQEEGDALRFGRLAHSLILEGEESFKKDFIMLPEGLDRRTKDGKAIYESIMIAAVGKTVVKADWVNQVRDMRKAIQQHFVWKYLQEGVSEGSHFWKDGDMDFKVRLDWIKSTDYGDIIVDYKTTVCAASHAFSRQIAGLGYHVQAAHYNEGFKSAFGIEPKAFLFVAQEKKAPYAVGAYMLSPEAIKTGAALRLKAIDIIKEGRKTGTWGGYTDKIEMIDIPMYAQYDSAEVLQQYGQGE